jgi:uncharacterized protein with HEPN domain
MSKREAPLLIGDILESANRIIAYTEGMSYEQFIDDRKTKDAVVRNFEIIGEAANRLQDEFKVAHPEINWHHLKGLRNRIVHEYFGIDDSIIWNIKEDYLPILINRLSRILL